MLTYIDHVTIAVTDISAAAEALRSRFSMVLSSVRSDETSGVTSAVIPLLQGYIQLVSPGETKGQARRLRDQVHTFVSQREGLFGFALRSSDLRADYDQLHQRGSTLLSPVQEAGESDVGGWWTAFPAEPTGVDPYLVEPDATAMERIRRAGAGQPLAIRSIEEVTVIVPKMEEAIARYERDFGLRPGRTFGRQVQIPIGGGRITLVPSAIAPLGTPIGIYSVSLGTTDIQGARAELRGKGIGLIDAPFSWGVASQIDRLKFFGAGVNLVQL